MSRAASIGPAGAPKAPSEQVVARVRRHGRVLVIPSVLLIATVGALTYAFAALPESWQQWTALGAAIAVIAFGVLLPFLAWSTRRTTITTRRVIIRSGVVTRTRRDAPLIRSIDIRVRQSPWQRMFRSGDVILDAGQEHPFVLKDVPRPALVQQSLHELIDAEHARTASPGVGAPGRVIDGDTVVFGTR